VGSNPAIPTKSADGGIMKQMTAACFLVAAVLLLEGCSTPSDYARECIMGKDAVRGHCDEPGQSDESKGYQPN
jgi:hypothetical protein